MIDWKAFLIHALVLAGSAALFAVAQYGAHLPPPYGPIFGLVVLWLGSSNAPAWFRTKAAVQAAQAAKKLPLVTLCLLAAGCSVFTPATVNSAEALACEIAQAELGANDPQIIVDICKVPWGDAVAFLGAYKRGKAEAMRMRAARDGGVP